tara:strand:- start:803 stop:1222 length:420 start_codon:yes stop_codon:yes gene_type:complete
MFNFFKKESDVSLEKEESFIEIACLLVHASKIDEQYTDQEKKIIEKTLLKFGAKVSDISNIISKAEDIEKNSNQILDFTRKIKDVDKEKKLIIIKSLWEIIYSDTKSDMYEANLMRRLTGLLYLDPKEVGDIKEEVKLK